MVIDIIIDRRDAIQDCGEDDWDYDKARELYNAADDTSLSDLCYALDYLEEEDVKRELCKYIDDQGYRPSLKDFVNSVDWLPKDTE
jgi:hypothetical protein